MTCALKAQLSCNSCALGGTAWGKVGLLWVGGQFYPKPSDWTAEALRQGVSRRIPALPKGFELGKTFVFVAHREAITLGPDEFMPAVFHVFKPRAVEFVVRGTETDDELAAIRKRGITPVRVERVEEPSVPFTLPIEEGNLPTNHRYVEALAAMTEAEGVNSSQA